MLTSIVYWNELDEEVMQAKKIHGFKAKQNENRYRDRKTRD